MDAPYTLRPDGSDVFRTFVLPIPTTAPRFVKAVEFHPGNRARGAPREHRRRSHAIVATSRRGRSGARLCRRHGAGRRLSGRLHARMDAGAGRRDRRPTAWRGVSSRAAISSSNSTCSRPANRSRFRSAIGFFFTDDPPTQTTSRPAARERNHRHRRRRRRRIEITDRYVLPVDVECWPSSRTRTISARPWRRTRCCPTAPLVR